MNQYQADLIVIYKNVLREVEGGEANFDEMLAVMNRNGIHIDEDLWPIEDTE